MITKEEANLYIKLHNHIKGDLLSNIEKIFNENGSFKDTLDEELINLLNQFKITTPYIYNQIINDIITRLQLEYKIKTVKEGKAVCKAIMNNKKDPSRSLYAYRSWQESKHKYDEIQKRKAPNYNDQDIQNEPVRKKPQREEPPIKELVIGDEELDEALYTAILLDTRNYEKGIHIKFGKNSKVKFSNLKQHIIAFLNGIKDFNRWFFKYSIWINGKLQWFTIPLNNEGIVNVRNILNGEMFEHQVGEEFNNGIDDRQITTSGTALEQFGVQSFNVNMINDICITPQAFGKKQPQNTIYCDLGGAFYDRKLTEDCPEEVEYLAERYQIFKDILLPDTKLGKNLPRVEMELNCLVYALLKSNQFSREVLDSIKSICYTRIVSRKAVNELGIKYKIRFTITKWEKDNNRWGHPQVIGCKEGYQYDIKLGLIRKHYFLDEEIKGVTSYYLRNAKIINNYCLDHKKSIIEWGKKVYRKNGKYFIIDESRAHTTSRELIIIIDQMYSKQLTFDDRGVMQTDLHRYVTNHIEKLAVLNEECKPIKAKEAKTVEANPYIFYADCEADVVTSEKHVAYCVSVMQRGSNEAYSFVGENCISQLFDFLPDKSIVYFHNLGYDSRLMSGVNILSAIDKNAKVMQQSVSWKGKTIKLKDSFSILSMPLRKFPATFQLETGEKEMFPYNYYTLDRLKSNRGVIADAGKDEINWNQEQFESNLDRLNLRLDGKYFDMIRYAVFYCEQDVRILKEGFDRFRELTLQAPIQMDVDEYISAPSIANAFFTKHIYTIENPDTSIGQDYIYTYSGVTRAFIQQAIYGGRCMTRDNEKWHVTDTLNDFDAVSLYPSAMKRLFVQQGKPVLLNSTECSTEYLLSHTAHADCQPTMEKPISSYIVEIEITKVSIPRHFPLIVFKDPETKTNRNINQVGVHMTVDNIMLEDLVQYQGIECKVIRGIKWTGLKDFKIRQVIQELHEYRAKYKAEHNPMQEIIKLIMNSAYGKCIQKPIDSDIVYKQVQTCKKYYRKMDKSGNETPLSKKRFSEAEKIEKDEQGNEYIYLQKCPAQAFMLKNHAKIKAAYDVDNNLVAIVVNKQIEDFSTNTLIGVQILSMSKRLMNEVMCTAEDNNIPIYYQDTDSMHIQNDLIPLLAEKYKERFCRDLIGKNLGQFHNDFDELSGNPVSVESYFLAKKAYIDKLVNEKNESAFHIRMKGIDLASIQLQVDRLFDGDPMKLYQHLYDGKSLTFNLLETKPRFKMNKDRTVSNVMNFTRKIQF